MQVTVAAWDDRMVTVDVGDDADVATLAAILEVELSLPAEQQQLLFNGQPLRKEQQLSAAGVKDNDVIMLVPSTSPSAGGRAESAGQGASQAAAAGTPQGLKLNPDGSAVSPAAFINTIKSNQQLMAQISAGNPRLAKAIREEDTATLQEELRAVGDGQRRERERQAELDQLMLADPFDPKVQQRIEELIQQKNIDENLEAAMENSPEVFGQVHMLYVNMAVNGHAIKAFIDSGAQMTIMTEQFADHCGLRRLIDKRFAGMAVGVGSSRIIGRVHQAPLQVAGHFITSSVTILEQKGGPQFIFGLDMMKRHQCCIDLQTNELRFGSANAAVPFLPEHEIPKEFGQQEDGAVTGKGAGTQDAVAPHGEAPAGDAAQQAARGGGAVDSGSSAAPSSAAAPAPQGGAQEAALQQLMQLGFPREACMRALTAANGNPEVAASLLFGGLD